MKTAIPKLKLVLTVFILTLAGCVARREAVRMNTVLESASMEAADYIVKLQRADAESFAQDYAVLRQLVTAAFEARRKNCETTLRAAHQRTVAEINFGLAQAMDQTHVAFREKIAELEPAVTLAMEPLYEKVKIYRLRADEAFNKAHADPGSLTLKQVAATADREYLATQGAAVDMKLDAIKDAVARLTDAHQFARVMDIAGQHRREADDALSQHLEKLSAESLAPVLPDLPDSPPGPDRYELLREYARNVQGAAKANGEYLRSNSFGRGSFFDSAFRGLLRGVTGGVLKPKSVKDLKLADVTNAGRDVFGEILNDAKSDFAEIKTSFINSAAQESRALLDEGFEKATEAIHSLVRSRDPKLNKETSGAR